MRIKEKTREEILIDSVKGTYLEFVEDIENPFKRGYMAVLHKLKPQSKELIKAALLDIKIEVEDDLISARNRMRGAMGYYDDDKPDGIKQS